MRKSTFLFVLGLAALVVVPAGAQKRKAKETRNENIPLLWTPTTELGELDSIELTGITGVSIEVMPLEDARREGEEIGKNVEDDRPKLVTTPDDVAAFVTENMADLLYDMGLKVVEADGQFQLQGELRKFYCEEGGTYKAETNLVMKLVDTSGKVVWESLITGSASRWGRSYKDENYYESLADSLVEATHRIVSSADFRRALKQ